jgi:hypothetical protein
MPATAVPRKVLFRSLILRYVEPCPRNTERKHVSLGQILSFNLDGRVVRWPVLSAAAVCLSRRRQRRRGDHTLQSDGAEAALRNNDASSGADAWIRRLARVLTRRRVVYVCEMAAHQADTCCHTLRVSRVPGVSHVAFRGGGKSSLPYLLSVAERISRTYSDRGRDPCRSKTSLNASCVDEK